MTALSDLEVVHKEFNRNLWFLAHPRADEPNRGRATTRPETMLPVITAVAVHPDDERYWIDRQVLVLPIVGRRIPIVADDAVDSSLVLAQSRYACPRHDDFEIGKRHNLPMSP